MMTTQTSGLKLLASHSHPDGSVPLELTLTNLNLFKSPEGRLESGQLLQGEIKEWFHLQDRTQYVLVFLDSPPNMFWDWTVFQHN